MPGLFGMLSTTANALEAQRYGLDVVGQNIANANTPGFSRRVVELGDVPPFDRWSAGSGVDILGMRATRDELLDRRFWREAPDGERHEAIASALEVAEVALGSPGASLDRRLGSFFDAFAELADAPTSPTARQGVVSEAASLANEFHAVATRLNESARDADRQIRGAVSEINALASQIANLNDQIGSASVEVLPHLVDQQRFAVGKLSEILDIDVAERGNGGLDVSFGHGRPLVINHIAYTVAVTSSGSAGYADIVSEGSTVTSEVTSGRIGGLLQVRDALVPAYVAELDALAYGVVTEVNAVHATGFDLNGVAGAAFFQALGGASGAASAIAVSTTITANPSTIAAAGVAVPGDNQGARTLAALRDQRVLGGGTATLTEGWAQLLYHVGADSASARGAGDAQIEVVRQLETMRDAVSGVSIDEEAAMMLRFQRAYEANARFFSTVNQAIDVLMNLGR